jgi:hypothetical protein
MSVWSKDLPSLNGSKPISPNAHAYRLLIFKEQLFADQ